MVYSRNLLANQKFSPVDDRSIPSSIAGSGLQSHQKFVAMGRGIPLLVETYTVDNLAARIKPAFERARTSGWAAVKVSGPDARYLLDSVTAANLNLDDEGASSFYCLLSHQGRITFCGLAFCRQQAYYLVVGADHVWSLGRALSTS